MRMNLTLVSWWHGHWAGALANRTMEDLAAQQVQIVNSDMVALERVQDLGRLLAQTRAKSGLCLCGGQRNGRGQRRWADRQGADQIGRRPRCGFAGWANLLRPMPTRRRACPSAWSGDEGRKRCGRASGIMTKTADPIITEMNKARAASVTLSAAT
jgi:hypothetical protein